MLRFNLCWTILVLMTLAQTATIADDNTKSSDEPARATQVELNSSIVPAGKRTVGDPDLERQTTHTDRWLNAMFDLPVPLLDMPGETPLSELLDVLSTH